MGVFKPTEALVALFACFALLAFNQPANGQWIDALPSHARQSILWSADNEEGTLNDWEFDEFEFPGGGVYNSGNSKNTEAETNFLVAHSGSYSVRTAIRNAFHAENGEQSVRLMRWTERPWDKGGMHFPKAAFYSTWMYFPENYNPNKYEPWDPGDGGWWNVFEFLAHDNEGVSRPMWSLNVTHDDESSSMEFYLYSGVNAPASYIQAAPISIPVGRWIHVEAFYRVSAGDEGRITIWQDGQQILDANNVQTAASDFDENAIWSIGNYTDHIAGGAVDGSATIYFDDSAISTRKLSGLSIDREPKR